MLTRETIVDAHKEYRQRAVEQLAELLPKLKATLSLPLLFDIYDERISSLCNDEPSICPQAEKILCHALIKCIRKPPNPVPGCSGGKRDREDKEEGDDEEETPKKHAKKNLKKPKDDAKAKRNGRNNRRGKRTGKT